MTAHAVQRVLGDMASELFARETTLSDHELLAWFVANRNESAFTALVLRHGPMVMSVCQRILGHTQDAEDAFQATFLVLARKARSLRSPELLANFLHGVAQRIATRGKSDRYRKRNEKSLPSEICDSNDCPSVEDAEILSLLDREITCLPAKYRKLVVLCELQGCSRKDAARQLRLPEGTVSSRLAMARRLLQKRMLKYGCVTSLASILSASTAQTIVARELRMQTTRIAVEFVAGNMPTTLVSERLLNLVRGVSNTMQVPKLSLLVVLIGITGLLLLSVNSWDRPTSAAQKNSNHATTEQKKGSPEKYANVKQRCNVPSQVEGVLQEVLVKTGEKVKKGQVLASIDDALAVITMKQAAYSVELARLKVKSSKTRLDFAKDSFQKVSQLVKNAAVGSTELDKYLANLRQAESEVRERELELLQSEMEMEKSRIHLDRHVIRAPFDGIVQAVHKQTGEAVRLLETVVEVRGLGDEKKK